MNTLPLHFGQPHPRHIFWSRFLWVIPVFLVTITLLAIAYASYLPENTIARGAWVDQTDLSGLSKTAASQRLQLTLGQAPSRTLTIVINDQEYATSSAQLGEQYDQEAILENAYRLGRTGSFWQQHLDRFRLFRQPQHLTPSTKLDSALVIRWVQSIATRVDKPGRPPAAKVSGKSYVLDVGEEGSVLAQNALIMNVLTNTATSSFSATLETVNTPLSPDGQIRARARLDRLRPKTLTLNAGPTDIPITLTAANFLPWLQLPDGFRDEVMSSDLQKLTKKFSRAPQDAQWEADPSNEHKLKVFIPDREGREANIELLQAELQHSLILLGNPTSTETPALKFDIPFETVQAQTTLGSLNPFGVKERIGYGTSFYAHSIPNRISNVALTSSRIDKTLVLPGEEFSFAKYLGEVDQAHGFKTAYIIKDGSTQLGDGGGVCQVSTTTFRAMLNAGLPVTKWKAHSYRVGYYEQNSPPGFDATVFAPSPDLGFINDTGHAIVVSVENDPAHLHLIVELWGTTDGRVSEITDYQRLNERPAPPTVYQDDPTLPRGVTKQIDFSAPGLTTKFTYTVKNADGTKKLQRTFTSNFQPWHATYLVGTGS